MESWWWHFRHGEVVAVADYQVPAPRNWYVQDVGDGDQMMIRLDTDDRPGEQVQGKKPRLPSMITMYSGNSAYTIGKLDLWTSFQVSMLKKKGVEPVLRTFNLDDEALSCVGGQKLTAALKAPQFWSNDPNTWWCQSSGRLWLQIMATDADMPQVWLIVSHIHKKSHL